MKAPRGCKLCRHYREWITSNNRVHRRCNYFVSPWRINHLHDIDQARPSWCPLGEEA